MPEMVGVTYKADPALIYAKREGERIVFFDDEGKLIMCLHISPLRNTIDYLFNVKEDH